MANARISELPAATVPLDGTELLEIVQGGINKRVAKSDVATGGSSDINRAWTETLLFDKKEITFAPHVMDGDLTYVLASSGHLVDSICGAWQTITADGVSSINFGTGFDFIYGVENGDVLEAGTYQIFFLYLNGSVTVNLPGTTAQSSGLTKLSTPGSFAVVADGENALDLSWADVANESGYQVEKSLNGSTGWVLYSNPSVGATSDTETGLNPGDIVYYRIKALGDGTIYSDSNYAYANGQTENSGDTTPPSFTFDPVNGDNTWTVNRPITITANEPIRNDNGTEITNANVASVITLKETNSGGADIPFSATISLDKTVITITPSTVYGESQVVYVAIHDVEDNDGNEIVSPSSITFTTTDWTYFNGTTNRLQFGDLLDSVWAVADTNFWLALTIRNHSLTGQRVFVAKADYSGNQRAFVFYQNGTDIYFNYYKLGTTAAVVIIRWTDVLTSGEHDLVLKYNGAVDTNNGRDRAVLEIDGVDQGPGTLETGTNPTPGNIFNGTAQLSVGVSVTGAGIPSSSQFFTGEAKDFVVTTASGATEQINVPLLADGQDVSGFARHGTWV